MTEETLHVFSGLDPNFLNMRCDKIKVTLRSNAMNNIFNDYGKKILENLPSVIEK